MEEQPIQPTPKSAFHNTTYDVVLLDYTAKHRRCVACKKLRELRNDDKIRSSCCARSGFRWQHGAALFIERLRKPIPFCQLCQITQHE